MKTQGLRWYRLLEKKDQFDLGCNVCRSGEKKKERKP